MSKRALGPTPSALTTGRAGAKMPSMKKRVLLAPATVSPKRALIRAAVEKVAADRASRNSTDAGLGAASPRRSGSSRN
jgi:hypothetical protein